MDSASATPSSNSTMTSGKQKLMMAAILIQLFLILCTDTVIFPFFPKEAVMKGLNSTHVGLVFSCYEFARFVTSPISGVMMLRLGPKNMCVIGSIMTVISCVSFGLTIEVSNSIAFLVLCLLSRLLAGVGGALLTVAGTSILLKSTSYSNSTIIGLLEMMSGVGYAIGPAFGAAIFELGGYQLIFWLLGGSMAAFTVMILIVIPDIGENTEQGNKNFLDLLKVPGLVLMFAHCVALKITDSSHSTGISEWVITTFDKSVSIVALLFGVWAICYVISCAVTAKLTDKGYIYTVMLTGWVTSLPFFLFMCPSKLLDFMFHGKKFFWLTVTTSTLARIVQAFLYIPQFQASVNLALLNGYEDDSLHTYGVITGMVNSGLSLGATAGPAMSGAITDALGFSWTTTVLASLDLVMAAIMSLYLVIMKLNNRPLKPREHQTTDNEGSEIESLIADKLNQQFIGSIEVTEVQQQTQNQQFVY